MARTESPEAGHMALLAAVQNVTGLVLDDDDDAHVFIKEESSSPPSDDDKSILVGRLKPLKFKPASTQRPTVPHAGRADNAAQQQPVRSGKHGGKAATSKAVLLRGAQAAGQPIIPRRIEDWEPWKSILHELYITQNRILRDIIGIMDTKHNLKATPKMYKNQFARWSFFKYAVKRRPRTQPDSSPGHSSDDSSGGELILTQDSLIHESEASRGVQVGLTAVRRFLHGYIDLDSANLQIEEVAGFVDPCYRYFKVAMDLFDLKENAEGGLILRLAFLQIERKIANPTMKSFSDLCFLVPHLLLESGRRDILAAYLRYLSRLATLKFGKHPVADLAASFAGMAERPEDMMRYIMALSQINADTIAAKAGMLGRTTQWARNQYLACQRTKELDPEPAWQQSQLLLGRDRHDHHMIRLEAQSVYWAQNLVMQDPDTDDLADQWLCRQFEADFGTRCEGHLTRLKKRVEAGAFPTMFARMMECLFVGWLFDYHETVGEWDKAFEWGRKGLALSTDEQYAIWSIHLEDLMRKHGLPGEAEELRVKRLSHAWLEKVRVEVDRLSIA